MDGIMIVHAFRLPHPFAVAKPLPKQSSVALVDENTQGSPFSFPIRWHYDVLRALEYFRAVGDAPELTQAGSARPAQRNRR